MVSETNELYFLLAFYSCKSCNQLALHMQFMPRFINCFRNWYKLLSALENGGMFCIFQRCLRWQDFFSSLCHIKSSFYLFFYYCTNFFWLCYSDPLMFSAFSLSVSCLDNALFYKILWSKYLLTPSLRYLTNTWPYRPYSSKEILLDISVW